MAIQIMSPFLSAEEYSVGGRRTEEIGGSTGRAIAAGQASRARQLALQKQQREEQEAIAKAEQDRIAREQAAQQAQQQAAAEEALARGEVFGAVPQAAPGVAQPVPAVPQVTQATAPTFAPTQSQGPAPMVAPIAPPAAQPIAAAPTMVAPAAPAAQPTEQPATPVEQSAAEQIQLPQTVDEAKQLPSILGVPNLGSNDARRADYVMVKNLFDQGQITATQARDYLRQRDQFREKAQADAIKVAKDLEQILTSQVSREESTFALQQGRREIEQLSPAFNIWEEFSKGNTQKATELARNYGIQFDPNNADDVSRITALARQSSKYEGVRTQERQIAAEERRAAGAVAAAGAAAREGARAGARGGEAARPAEAEEGQVIVDQKTGQEFVQFKPTSAQLVEATAAIRGSNIANQSFSRMGQLYEKIIRESKIDPNSTTFGANFNAWWQANINRNPDIQEYNALKMRAVSDSLRLNKGPQTDQDFNREAEGLTNLGMSPQAHRNILNRLKKYNDGVAEYNQFIQRGRLLVNPGAPTAQTPTQPAGENRWSRFRVQ